MPPSLGMAIRTVSLPASFAKLVIAAQPGKM
jgi:hypothetical protein